jgi:hypothetical protein
MRFDNKSARIPREVYVVLGVARSRVVWKDAGLGKIWECGGGIREYQPLYLCLRSRPSQPKRNFTNDLMSGVTPCERLATERKAEHRHQ